MTQIYYGDCDFPSVTTRRHYRRKPRLNIKTDLEDCTCNSGYPITLPDPKCPKCNGTGSVRTDTGYAAPCLSDER